MKEISITGGYKTIVDDDDFERLSKFKYQYMKVKGSKTTYARREEQTGPGRKNRRTTFIHHDVLGRPAKGLVTDHINGNGLDNRRSNLRTVTYTQNAANNRQSVNPTGYRGVTEKKLGYSFFINHKKYNRRYYLSRFKTAEEAAHARDQFAKAIWGEYAYLNFPEN